MAERLRKKLPGPLTMHMDDFAIIPSIEEIGKGETVICKVSDGDSQMYIAVAQEGSDEIALHETDSSSAGDTLAEVATGELKRIIAKTDVTSEKTLAA